MITSQDYASVALVDLKLSGAVSLVTVSVTRQECIPSGAWAYDDLQSSEFLQILENRLILILGNRNASFLLPESTLKQEIAIQDFIQSANQKAHAFLVKYDQYVAKSEIEYATYMTIKPKERKLLPKLTKKNLVRPDFFNWPNDVNLEESSEYLNSLGKLSTILGTPTEMEKVITASRLLKLFIDGWRTDELERTSRPFVEESGSKNLLLPEVWQIKLDKVI